MKNLYYTLLAAALVFCFRASAQDQVPLEKATALCPTGVGIVLYYATLDDAKRACGDKAKALPSLRPRLH